jgi:fructose-1-phosphate kinase PfkB-like protein
LIVAVTLNPSLLVDYTADRLEFGAANRVSRVQYRPGGRGLAVAQLVQTFGHEVVAAGLAGGSAGELIRTYLARAGVPAQFTRIAAESRRVVRVADAATGQITGLAEPAPYITTEELGRLAADYRGLLDGATAVVLCGSLPAGLPADIYGSLTSYANVAGVPVILDAGGSPFRHGAARGPALAIPELAAREPAAVGPGVSSTGSASTGSGGTGSGGTVSGGTVSGGTGSGGSTVSGMTVFDSTGSGSTVFDSTVFDSTGEVDRAGAGALVLPAPRGVRVLTGAGEWLAELPPSAGASARSSAWTESEAAAQPQAAGSAAGPEPIAEFAGGGLGGSSPRRTAVADGFRAALVAGLVPGIELAWSWPDMLRNAVALATSVAPSGEADLAAYEALLPLVEVTGPVATA